MSKEYRTSSKIKILTHTWLISLSIFTALIFTFTELQFIPIPVLLFLLFLFPTLIVYFAWTLPKHKKSNLLLNHYIRSVKNDSIKMHYISPKEATFDVLLLMILILIILILSAYSWFSPKAIVWSNWVIGLCACPIFNYSWRDRISTIDNSRMERFFEWLFFVLVIIVYSAIVILYINAPDKLIFSKENKTIIAYLLSTSAWFSFGILSAFIPVFLNIFKRFITRT